MDDRNTLFGLINPVCFVGGASSSAISSLFAGKNPDATKDDHGTEAEWIDDGGCRIGPTMNEGSVNSFGQVYDGGKKSTDPKATYPGLFVVDGSVFRALAANPTLTIAAQALRAVENAVGPIPNI